MSWVSYRILRRGGSGNVWRVFQERYFYALHFRCFSWYTGKTKSTTTMNPNHMIRSNDWIHLIEVKIKTKHFKRQKTWLDWVNNVFRLFPLRLHFCKVRQRRKKKKKKSKNSPCLHIVYNMFICMVQNCTCFERMNAN